MGMPPHWAPLFQEQALAPAISFLLLTPLEKAEKVSNGGKTNREEAGGQEQLLSPRPPSHFYHHCLFHWCQGEIRRLAVA